MGLPVSSASLETLRLLGLTEYQARAYVALVALGTSEGREVGEATDIPRTRVHSVLGELAEAGWVDVDNGRPMRYTACPPVELLQARWKRLEDAFEVTRDELAALEGNRLEPVPATIWYVPGVDGIREHTLRAARLAREDLFCCLSFNMPFDGDALVDALANAARRGVHVRVLAAPDVAPTFHKRLRDKGVDGIIPMRVSLMPPRIVLADESVVLVVPPPTPEDADAGRQRGIWNALQPFIRLMRPAIENFWADAEPHP